MLKPIIGITTSRTTIQGSIPQIGSSESYLQAVCTAGGLPVLIPFMLDNAELAFLFSHLDGLLIPGGPDIDPKLYQGTSHPEVYGVDPERDRAEILLVQKAVESKKPFLGICRGIQVINVALGGKLFSHIPDQLPGALRHAWYPDIPRDYLAHTVKIDTDSRLYKILGSETVETNSLHHQGISQAGRGLKPVAWAPDGLIEAVELEEHPFGLGVQWHPENLQALPEMRTLFSAFIQASLC